jgi:hypothetical protein
MSRLNFLGSVENLCLAFKEPMILYNLYRYLRHVGTCDDPTCGTVICIDGNEKVCRKICGEQLDPPSAETGYDPLASDVHNAMSRAIMREKKCPNAPSRRGQGSCKQCQDRALAREAMAVSTEPTSPRRTRSCNNKQHSHEAVASNIDTLQAVEEDVQVLPVYPGDEWSTVSTSLLGNVSTKWSQRWCF